jgi:hypothetical protein
MDITLYITLNPAKYWMVDTYLLQDVLFSFLSRLYLKRNIILYNRVHTVYLLNYGRIVFFENLEAANDVNNPILTGRIIQKLKSILLKSHYVISD